MINTLNNKIGRNILFVRHGVHKGEFLVEVDNTDTTHVFLGLPDKTIHKVDKTDVKRGLKDKVILVVEKLPKAVYNVCLKEYKHLISEQQRINNHN